MKIEQVNTDSTHYAALQNFVLKHEVFFNAANWLKNYSEPAIVQCALFNKNNDIIGCFIYYQFKKNGFKFIITPPYSPSIDLYYLNPAESVVGKNSFHKDVLTLIADYFVGLNFPYINLNLPYEVIDTQPFIWKGFTSKTRYSYLIDLSKTEEELWENLATEKRKSINKALKDSLEIKQTTDYKLVHSLIIKSLEKNNKDKNLETLKNILFTFSEEKNAFAFVAYKAGEAIGATYCIVKGDKAMYLFGGFDSENKHHGAGVSCMWQSILKAKDLNLKYFDFEGSMNAPIERYFREFGGDLQPYFCVEKIKPLLHVLLNLKGHKPV